VSDDDVQRRDGDPRDRPPDPAGTRPKVDPASLLPAPRERQWLEPAPGAAPAVAAPIAPEPPADADAGRPHLERFQFVLGALVACAVAAIAAFVVVVAGGGDDNLNTAGPTWSSWKPTAQGVQATEQIAEHVGSTYKTSAGRQLVVVTGGPLAISNAGLSGGELPLSIVLQQSAAHGGTASLVDGTGVMYRLCGLAAECAIDGTPSQQRWLLVRREALELALYTFRYLQEVDNVVVLTPPTRAAPGAKAAPTTAATPATRALFFRRGDVGPQISRPLSATLSRTVPRPDAVKHSPDSGTVDLITGPRVFAFKFQQANADNSGFLVLQQPD
jgi:hypothetical protein